MEYIHLAVTFCLNQNGTAMLLVQCIADSTRTMSFCSVVL